MFGGSDQPPPPAQAPLQRVESSTETVAPPSGASATQKAAGAGQLPSTQTPGVLTETEANKKPATGSLIGEA